MHDMESYDYRDDRSYRDDYGYNNRMNYRNNYMGSYRDYRDDYGRNRRTSYRGNYRNYRDEYSMMLEDIADDGMELARAYEDVSEMATENSEKQKLMKMAEREKEHYRTVKEMLQKRM